MLVRDLIDRHKSEFTTSERRIIPFLKDDSLVIELQSITKLAEAAEVSTPTVIRLARKLGFDGFPSMQSAIRAELAERIKQPLAKLDTQLLTENNDHIINQFARQIVSNVNQTIGQIDHAEFDRAAQILSDFNRSVYLIGGRITEPTAYYFANQLKIVRPNVTLMNSSQNTWPQTILDMNDKSVLVLFDIRRYEKKMQRLVDLAIAAGARIILFTDQWGSPLERTADYCFRAMVQAPSSWDSTVALNFLVESFVAQIQSDAAGESSERLKQMEEMIGATGIFKPL